jgi:N-acetyl-gamma-glutamyl-phosphate reductase
MSLRVGIIGGAGYTGGELIRLLLHHPEVEIDFVHSRSNPGRFVHEVHSDLLGDTDLKFTDFLNEDVHVNFLCLGHGNSRKFLGEASISDRVSIIDLSQDFRLKSGLEREFVYGLPELQRDKIREADNIANPGCFATGIQLGLLPLAKEQLLRSEIQVNAITGSTGAGQSPSDTTHFSWRSGNVSVYKAFTHRHLNEIHQSLHSLQESYSDRINFIPMRGNFTRGILAAMHLKSNQSLEESLSLYEDYYADHPFVHISKSNPDLKQVVNTNKCFLYLEKHRDNLLIISLTDNLIKGAAGQAIQNMNLMFDLEETTGLQLKPSAF